MSVSRRYEEVRARVAAAAERGGRSGDEVTLVAVSKGFPGDVVAEAVRAGAVHLGENRVQELREKAIAFPTGVRWHFIGHLQTNKARQVVGVASLIHSVDRLALADELARRARIRGVAQDVLIEVNVSGEATKHGIEPAAAPALAEQVAALDPLVVRGFMTMAPLSPEPEESRPYFAELRELRDRVEAVVPSATELSMGMTRDFEVGVEEGATLVRVGEAIFGPRARR
ncbi:MAG: YggS family pyridoxal phosphate-dependent enzyme [Actinomycetota bacterium]|nr:YggS family pyridoxal phosphate-dependent enzyme [Actinomycetota bacterium]